MMIRSERERAFPHDIHGWNDAPPVVEPVYQVGPRTIVALVAEESI
ncbi:MAG: hypothetical protein R6W76_17635 [Caldilinea sp.]